MKNLFKYELRKTLFPKLILAGIAVLLEAFFLIALFRSKPNQQAVAIMLLIVLPSFGILYIGIQSLLTLHRDMNTRQGYMLFMTPNSSYKILGAKVLENTCTTLLIAALVFLLCLLDVRLMTSRNQDLTETMRFLTDIVSGMGGSLNLTLGGIAIFVLYLIMNWVSTITLAYFADILVSSVLNGKRFSALLGFILFLLLSYLVGLVGNLLPKGSTTTLQYGILSAYYALITVLTYFGSAKLMDRHLSI